MKQLIVVTLLMLTLILAPTLALDSFAKQTKADKKAEKKIEGALEKYVKDHYDKYCIVKVLVKGKNTTHTVYDKGCVIVPPPPPPPPTNIPPTAKIETSKLIANISDIIQLSGNKSTDSDGVITSYNWTGANFTNSNTTNTQFTFPNESQVTVSLMVTDNNGSKASASVQIAKWLPTVPSDECPLGEVKDPVTGQCTTPPEPQNTTVIFTGDVSGTAVLDQIVKQDPDVAIVAGDLGYMSTLAWFKDNYGASLGEQLRCVEGNHEAANEDGNAKLDKETLAFCGDHWYMKVANSTTLLIGFNSNGDAKSETAYVKSITGDSAIMKGVQNVILFSHKGGHVNPNSHHPAEAASVYSAINKISGVKVIEVSAHNHVMSSAVSEGWYISGAGGKSHYSCGIGGAWTFCNNSVYGYLEFVISGNGVMIANFHDTTGKIIK